MRTQHARILAPTAQNAFDCVDSRPLIIDRLLLAQGRSAGALANAIVLGQRDDDEPDEGFADDDDDKDDEHDDEDEDEDDEDDDDAEDDEDDDADDGRVESSLASIGPPMPDEGPERPGWKPVKSAR